MPNIHKLLDASGKVTDAELAGRLAKQAEGYIAFVEKLRAKKLK